MLISHLLAHSPSFAPSFFRPLAQSLLHPFSPSPTRSLSHHRFFALSPNRSFTHSPFRPLAPFRSIASSRKVPDHRNLKPTSRHWPVLYRLVFFVKNIIGVDLCGKKLLFTFQIQPEAKVCKGISF